VSGDCSLFKKVQDNGFCKLEIKVTRSEQWEDFVNGANVRYELQRPKKKKKNKKYGLLQFRLKIMFPLKNCLFWHVTPCGSSKNRRFGGT
jgi:hypothetical protein